MSKLPYIFTSVAVVLAALFAILNRFWTGFAYFVLSCCLLLALFWGAWLIYKYFTDFKHEIDERFKFYKAQKVNKSQVDESAFEANQAAYKKDFDRRMIKDKIIKWFIILFCFALAAAFLVGMILYKQA